MGVVFVTLAATLCIQLGYFLWKMSADRQPVIGRAPVGQLLRSHLADWRWLLGFAATVAGWLLFVHATGLGEISLVQPLMSVGDLLLVAMTVAFLHERLGRVEWGGVALTAVGALMLSFGEKAAPEAAFAPGRLAALMAGAAVAAGALLLAARRAARPELALAVAVGIAFGCGAVLTEAMSALQHRRGDAALAGTTLLNPLLPAVIGSNVVGLVLLQAAFQRGRAAMIVPVQLAVGNAIAVVAGALAFAEAVGAWRLAAVGLIVGGTALLHVGHRGSA